jgi:DNA primase
VEAPSAVQPSALDPLDREVVQLALNEPGIVEQLVGRVAIISLRDAPLRTILQACYDLHAEGLPSTFDRVTLRLRDPRVRELAVGLLSLIAEPAPLPEDVRPAPVEERFERVLLRLAQRDWQERRRDLEQAKREINPATDPEPYRAVQLELLKHLNQRPDMKKRSRPDPSFR